MNSRYTYKDEETGNFATWYPQKRQWHIGTDYGSQIAFDRWMDDYSAKTHYKIDGIVTAKKIVQAKNIIMDTTWGA